MIELRKAKFAIDSIPNISFEGYTNGETWNGWACPYFEKSEAEHVLQASEANHFKWVYNTGQNTFIVYSDDDEAVEEIFEAVQGFLEDGNEIIVYGIGAYSWIWELAAEE
jgi:poly-gamma-glutamate capsule biosynthesis protein CapA/YwtB (metallophosphatase superfamily)